MGRAPGAGDAYDHAMCGSFFATIEYELLDRHRFATPTDARRAVFECLEGGNNPHRRRSALDCRFPLDCGRSQISSN